MRDEEDTARRRIFAYVNKTYQTKPDYPWRRYPSYAVFRHKDTKKWYGILMRVPAENLGLHADGFVEVLNVRIADPVEHEVLLREPGILPAYHMNRSFWLSILVETVPSARVTELLDESFAGTRKRKTRERRGPREWLIPASVGYCDPRHFFDMKDTVTWTQSSNVQPGDTVYIYAGVPIGALLYRCRAVETDLPAEGELKKDFKSSRMMRLKLEAVLDDHAFTREKMKEEYGIYSVRGPRYVPNSLSEALRRYLGG